jgi:hypothetical protein
MSGPGVDQVGERPLDELVQNASQQAVVLAREQLDVARHELLARAGRAAPGLGLIGGGALLGMLASGTGTASLILLLARRPGASAAALAVTAAYAGGGALMARGGLARLQDAGAPLSDATSEDELAKGETDDKPSAKRRTRSAAKSVQGRVKSPTTSPKTSAGRRKLDAKSPAPARRVARDRRRKS